MHDLDLLLFESFSQFYDFRKKHRFYKENTFGIIFFQILTKMSSKPNMAVIEEEDFDSAMTKKRTQNYASKSINFREFTRRITPPSCGRKTPNLLDIVSILFWNHPFLKSLLHLIVKCLTRKNLIYESKYVLKCLENFLILFFHKSTLLASKSSYSRG